MKTLIKILLVFILFSACEKEEDIPINLSGAWSTSDPNYKIDISLFQSGPVISGTGEMECYFADILYYDIIVAGNYFHPIVTFTLLTEKGDFIGRYDGYIWDNKTIQGKLNGAVNLIFQRQ